MKRAIILTAAVAILGYSHAVSASTPKDDLTKINSEDLEINCKRNRDKDRDSKSRPGSPSNQLKGPPGPMGPPFVASYGSWYMQNEENGGVGEVDNGLPIAIPAGSSIPFNSNEVSGEMINRSGEFIFSKTGIYMVTFGVYANEPNVVFDLELNGALIPGGRLEPSQGVLISTTVMFSANAKDRIHVKNNSEHEATIGSASAAPQSVSAYISILQFQ